MSSDSEIIRGDCAPPGQCCKCASSQEPVAFYLSYGAGLGKFYQWCVSCVGEWTHKTGDMVQRVKLGASPCGTKT